MAVDLLKPVTSTRTRSINFFNGRLLAGEDLTTEQQANRAAHSFLGQAIGDGVVYGLEVKSDAQASTLASPVLSVSRGLAVNRNGATLYLENDTEVSLSRPPDVTNGVDPSSIFQDCTPIETGTYIAAAGVYLLTIGPASDTDGLAEVMGISTTKAVCNTKYNVQGVQFRLLKLDFTTTELDDVSHLRNLVAYRCFGVSQQAAFVADPFDETLASYGLIDDLRGQSVLTNCELPLAVLYWTATSGVVFVDMWAVRRPVFAQPATGMWAPFVSRRHMTEGIATFLQFQDQVDQIVDSVGTQASLAAISVEDDFLFLPAAGVIPTTGNGSPHGFDYSHFFGNLSSGGPTLISGAKLGKLLHESWLHRPVDLSKPAMLQLYQVRENVDAVDGGTSKQLYVIFVSRELQGITEHDATASTLQEAWEAYRGLVTERAFLPNDVTSDAIGARITILNAFQTVMAVASQKAALAAAGSLDYDNALEAFDALYAVQKELAVLLEGSIPGTSDPPDRVSFGTTLLAYLDTAIPGGITALKPAIALGDLPKTIQAQQAINQIADTGSGEGAALGFIDVVYQSSSRGIKLVPGDKDPFPNTFTVSNHTDKTLTINLAATISAAHGTWDGSVQFKNTNDVFITSVKLASQVSQDVNAAITVPGDAKIGDSVTLTVNVSVPAPHNKNAQAVLDTLEVAGAEGPPIDYTVVFDDPSLPGGDLNDVQPGATLTYIMNVHYTATKPPNTATFTMRVTLTSDPASALGDWNVFFAGLPRNNPSAGVFESPGISLTAGAQDTQLKVQIKAPAAKGSVDKNLSFKVTMESTDLPDTISTDSDDFTLKMTHA